MAGKVITKTVTDRAVFLQTLEQQKGQLVTGEEIRQVLGIDRHTVTNHYKALLADGHPVISTPKGYMMLDVAAMVDTEVAHRLNILEARLAKCEERLMTPAMSTGMVISGNAENSRERLNSVGKRGRRKVSEPSTDNLIDAIARAHQQGKTFYVSGKNGLFARKSELPEGFNNMGKHRLEDTAKRLIAAGNLSHVVGRGLVPTVPGN